MLKIQTGGGGFVKKLLRSIIVPYFIFAFVFWLTKVLGVFAVRHDYMLLLKRFVGIFFCMSGKSDYYCGYWFLFCLFFAEVFSFFLIRKYGITNSVVLFSFGVALLVSYMTKYCNIVAPYFLDTALVAQFFVVLGRRATVYLQKYHSRKYGWILGYLVLICMVNYSKLIFGQKFDMACNSYGNSIMFFIVAVTGIVSTVLLAFCLQKVIILRKIGKYSLYLYGIQMPIMALNGMFVRRFGVPQDYVTEFVWYCCLLFIFFIMWKVRGFYDIFLNFVLRRVAR